MLRTAYQIAFLCVLFIRWDSVYAQAKEHLQVGKQLLFDGKYDSALIILRKADEFSGIQDNLDQGIDTKYAIGECLLNMGRCDEAISVIEWALNRSIEKFGKQHNLTLEGYYFLSQAEGGCARNFKQAIRTLANSSSVKSERYGPSSDLLVKDLNMFGYYNHQLGNYDTALIHLNQAMKIQNERGIKDSMEFARTLSFLSDNHQSKDNFGQALKLALQALEIRKKVLVENHPTISNSLNDVGNIYKRMGNPNRAISYFLEALEMRKQTLGERHPNVGGSYYTIGNLYGNLFNYRRAIHYLEQGNDIMQASFGEESPIVIVYLAYLGRMHSKLGEKRKAERLFDLAEFLSDQHMRPDHPYLATIYSTLGEHYGNNPDFQMRYLDKAREICRLAYGPGTVREADALLKLGDASYKKSDTISGKKYYEEALSIYLNRLGENNDKTGTIYLHHAKVFQEQGQYQKALKFYSKALGTIADSVKQGIPNSLESINHKQLAFHCISQAANTYRLLYDQTGHMQFLEESFSRYQFVIDLMEFIISNYELEVSIAQFEEEARVVIEEAVNIAFELYGLTKDNQYKHAAFEVIERSKSPVLRLQTSDREAKRFNNVPDSLLNRERDLKIAISYFKRELKKAENAKEESRARSLKKEVFDYQHKFEAFKSKLEEQYPSFYDYKYGNQVLDLEQIRKQLAANASVIEFFQTKTFIYTFLINDGQFELIRRPIANQFEQLIANYFQAITDYEFVISEPKKADSLYLNSASQLYDLLLKPSIESLSHPTNKLIIVPDGQLSQINFGVFLTELPASSLFKYNELSYLINTYDISYAYSSTLNFRPLVSNAKELFAGFAPSYKKDEFTDVDSSDHPLTYQLVRNGKLPLPGAIDEVTMIRDYLSGSSWTEEQATESVFKQVSSNYKIIHLAMHSLLNDEVPEYSELLFNSEEDSLNDGYLSIDEIYNLDLSADLVVLSACSSGNGRLQVGEGPISFTRAFRYAGCPSVIMTMWKIPDRTTTDIIISFYQHIEAGYPKDVALRKAQLQYLQATEDPLYQHPFFWASFVTMGNTAPVKMETNDRWVVALPLVVLFLLAVFFFLRRRIS